ncbi:dTDP-4-dehydrorhamnose reductase [Paenibacillus oryzae]|uniref:dTDP-4-dehydrorhamnose reductase n=1 Tax=Paenibacillus oryzae TaxID=1844972 RepID=A0A1A5YS13_9BACL|nr:dTDP-4-dehydrorhamnose reductase [Paenibacillus oryzae]OBR68416.1 dTDP-4-dehydrorhamnose reductase [Paenibacillus oryzae]
MNILVTGVGGQLGFDVVQRGYSLGLNMIGTTSSILDITDEAAVSAFVHKHKPDAVIHCAAYTAVDKAEDDKENCRKVNVDGTTYLAAAAKQVQAKFIYISTDYVFDGEGQEAFKESDSPSPINYYGLTKYEGEQVVRDLLSDYFIVRISWVFGMNGNNFVKTMLRLAETRGELNVVGDQWGSPTYTADLARLLLDLVRTDKYGIYHASNDGFCSWADFAREIFAAAHKDIKVNGITTDEYPTRAVRPKNSRMSKQKLIEYGLEPLPPWQDAVKRFLDQLKSEERK